MAQEGTDEVRGAALRAAFRRALRNELARLAAGWDGGRHSTAAERRSLRLLGTSFSGSCTECSPIEALRAAQASSPLCTLSSR